MKIERDCVIVGGGPAGMAAAIALKKLGIDDVLVLERNDRTGGILNQCIHPGFGLSRFGRDLTGPEYARALEREFVDSGAECATGAMVLGISESRVLRVMSRHAGYAEIRALAIIVATGCRERTRENLEIAGTRPAGLFTAGQAQNLINLQGYRIGERVLIQGSGDIGLIMARRLMIEGCRVDGVFERLPYLSGLIRNKVQCLDHFGIPLRLGSQICEIAGKRRVEGVWVECVDAEQRPIAGTREFHPCDTVLFSVGLIPEVDILKSAGLIPPLGRSLDVNSHFEATASVFDGVSDGVSGGEASCKVSDGVADSGFGTVGKSTGIFLCGNALHIHDLADNASKEGELVARHVALYLRSRDEYAASSSVRMPYRPIQADTRFDADWFGSLGGAAGSVGVDSGVDNGGDGSDGAPVGRVCIVCPKGCIVSDEEATCPRGAAYNEESKRGRFQPMTTTIASRSGEKRTRLPVRSLEVVEVADIPPLKRSLTGLGTGQAAAAAAIRADGESLLSVRLGDRDVFFSISGKEDSADI